MGRTVFMPINDKIWFDYFLSQAKQTGHGGMIGYQGTPYQRGNGLGSFLGRLFRSILPVAKSMGKSALKTVGKEALNMGANVLGDVTQGKQIKNSLKEHGLQATKNLTNKAINKVIRTQSGGRVGKRKVASKVSSLIPAKKSRKSKKKLDFFD